jgi:tRNA-modifying protein YgfZ
MEEKLQRASFKQPYFLPLQNPGLLLIQGPDRFDFIQRQTTRDILELGDDLALLSVLTSPVGRILDVLYIFKSKSIEDALQIITLPGNGPNTARFLKSRIFFKDNVKIIDQSSEISQVDLLNPQIPQILQEAGISIPSAEERISEGSLAGTQIQVIRLEKSTGMGWRILVSSSELQILNERLIEAGIQEISADVYNILRVEKGLPAARAELSEEFTPLEVGLRSSISENKGCYTGQEVIARQINYDKVTRHLVGLKLEALAAAGSMVKAENKPAGQITSSVISSRYGPIALAVIKRPYQENGTQVVVHQQEQTVKAGVIELPFH